MDILLATLERIIKIYYFVENLTDSMNILMDKLKNDTLTGMFDLTGKSVLPIAIASIVYVVLSNLILVPFLLSSIGVSQENLEELQQLSSDPLAMQREMENMMEIIKAQFTMEVILMFIVAMIVLSLVSCWVYSVAFLTMKKVLDEEKPNISEILSTSFNGKVFSLFISSILISIVFIALYLGVFLLTTLLSSISSGLAVLIGFSANVFLFAFMLRFILVMPIIMLEDVSVIDSFKHSINSIPMRKGFKYLLIGILAMMVLFIVFMVVGLIFGLLGAIPIVGVIFGLVGNIISNTITIGLGAALMMALYYKYRANDNQEGLIEDHLVYDN